MKRVLEPELMEDTEQAEAYAQANFEDAHSRVVGSFKELLGNPDIQGHILDLGCGPGDIAFRFARAYPGCVVHGVDGSRAMLQCGWNILTTDQELKGRVELIHGMLPGANLPQQQYDAVISNSLLHHLHEPAVLWEAVRRWAAPGAPVFIMDLKRPGNTEDAEALVEQYSANEPEVLKQDFYNSLLAAFTPGEVREQLEQASLGHLEVRETTDRHQVIFGTR